MESINYYYEMVENIIRGLGVDPAVCRGEKEGQWNLQKGSAPVWIDVWTTQDNYGYFQAIAPVCEIPTVNTQAFYQEVLEINHQLYGVGMTKYENRIYMKVIRELDGLDQNEALAMFNRVGYYADEYDDLLKNKYFGGNQPGERV
ncbi:MAG: YbjN domain-containing protein [Bacteroidia bacterium]|nr:YbjN domain-containing protein [Bacteroidia bacterium]